jgi:hypothetical protein
MQSKCGHLIRALHLPAQKIPNEESFFFVIGKFGQPSLHLKRFS